MAAFLRGLGAAAARMGEIGMADVLERRRQEGLLRIQQQLAQENYKQQRVDAVADEASRRTFETERDNARISAAAAEGDKNRQTEIERARIAASAARDTPAYDVAVSEEPILDELGRPVYTENARGETVIATRKVPTAFNRFTGAFGNSPSAKDDSPVEIDDAILSRLRGEQTPSQTPAPSGFAGGLARAKEAERQAKAAAIPPPPAPIMRQGKLVEQRTQVEPVYRNGKLVEQR